MKHEIFVSPTGSDDASGLHAELTPDRNDGPLQSLRFAIANARQLHRDSCSPDPVTIWLRGGRYPLYFPIHFGPDVSGAVELKAYPGEEPVFDGGVRVREWAEETVDRQLLWKADVSKILLEHGNFCSLFAKGRRLPRASYPANQELWMDPEGVDDKREGDVSFVTDLVRGNVRFRARPGDVDAIKDWRGAEVVILNRWAMDRIAVANYSNDTRIIELACSTRLFLQTEFEDTTKTTRYYLDNVREGLSEPGAWYLDREARQLWYHPLPGESISSFEAVVPVLQQFLRIVGNKEQGPVRGLRFEGITFEHADWEMPSNRPLWWDPARPESEWDHRDSFRVLEEINSANPSKETGSASQAAFNLPGAIFFERAENCEFKNCVVRHVGYHGISVWRGCRQIRIDHNRIEDMGAGGVLVDGADVLGDPADRTERIAIEDNAISGGGQVFRNGCGVVVMHAAWCSISHNEIHDMTYSGISCGWTWGLFATVNRENRIVGNHIHDIGRRGGMSDMGGIYLLGIQPGTIIRENYVHDIHKTSYGGWGIYLDEGSAFLTIEKNVVCRTASESLMEHMGRQNTFRNNLLVAGGSGGLFSCRGRRNRWSKNPSEGGIFLRNIIVTDGAPIMHDALGYEKRNPLVRALNLYWNQKGDVRFRFEIFVDIDKPFSLAELDFAAWSRDASDESATVVADPLLDFDEGGLPRLHKDSPAWKLGFEPLDPASAGPQPIVVSQSISR